MVTLAGCRKWPFTAGFYHISLHTSSLKGRKASVRACVSQGRGLFSSSQLTGEVGRVFHFTGEETEGSERTTLGLWRSELRLEPTFLPLHNTCHYPPPSTVPKAKSTNEDFAFYLISESSSQARFWFLIFLFVLGKRKAAQGLGLLPSRPLGLVPPIPGAGVRPLPKPPPWKRCRPPPSSASSSPALPAAHPHQLPHPFPHQASRPTVPAQTPDPWREFPVLITPTFHDTRGSQLSPAGFSMLPGRGGGRRWGWGRGLAAPRAGRQYLLGLRWRGTCLLPWPHQVTTECVFVCQWDSPGLLQPLWAP